MLRPTRYSRWPWPRRCRPRAARRSWTRRGNDFGTRAAVAAPSRAGRRAEPLPYDEEELELRTQVLALISKEDAAAIEADERMSCFEAGSAADTASMAGSDDNLGGADERERARKQWNLEAGSRQRCLRRGESRRPRANAA